MILAMTDNRSFTEIAWAATSEIRHAINRHPFVLGLQDGSLEPSIFLGYLAQDSPYLLGYAQALAQCAAQANKPVDIAFWATSAHDTIVVERALHESRVADLDECDPSPTCTAYVSYLLATAGRCSYPVLAAALTPCFWIYQDIGQRLRQAPEIPAHPYQEWIGAYGDAEFALSVDRVKQIVNGAAAAASESTRAEMLSAFFAAVRYEWMFFDAAWRKESWPTFGTDR